MGGSSKHSSPETVFSNSSFLVNMDMGCSRTLDMYGTVWSMSVDVVLTAFCRDVSDFVIRLSGSSVRKTNCK